jgi:hypothetical protein
MIWSTRMGLAVGIILASPLMSRLTHPCLKVAPRYKVLPNFDVLVHVPRGIVLEGNRAAFSGLEKDHVPSEMRIAKAFTDRVGRGTLQGPTDCRGASKEWRVNPADSVLRGVHYSTT